MIAAWKDVGSASPLPQSWAAAKFAARLVDEFAAGLPSCTHSECEAQPDRRCRSACERLPVRWASAVRSVMNKLSCDLLVAFTVSDQFGNFTFTQGSSRRGARRRHASFAFHRAIAHRAHRANVA